MNEQDIQKLRDAGFSDEDIRDYQASRQRNQGPVAPGAQPEAERRGDQGPDLDPNAPSETLARAKAQGVPTEGRESSFIDDVITAAPVVAAEYAVPIAVGAGGAATLYGANQIRKGMQARAAGQAAMAEAQMAQANAAMEQARAAQMQAQGVQERFAQRQAARVAPVAPQTPQILDAQGRPIVRAPVAPAAPVATAPVATAPVQPVAPSGPMPAGATAGQPPLRPTAAPSIVDRATNIVRQIAANKVVQGAARLGNVAGIAAMALTPSNSGQDYPFPMSGPLRGSELNPATGRPWSREELAAYYRAQAVGN